MTTTPPGWTAYDGDVLVNSGSGIYVRVAPHGDGRYFADAMHLGRNYVDVYATRSEAIAAAEAFIAAVVRGALG